MRTGARMSQEGSAMRKHTWTPIVLSTLVVLAAAQAWWRAAPRMTGVAPAKKKERPDRGGKLAWRVDADAAFDDAEIAGRRVLIYFTSDG